MIVLPIITSIIFGIFGLYVFLNMVDDIVQGEEWKFDCTIFLICVWQIVSSWILYYFN
jgi:hypothetical protein